MTLGPINLSEACGPLPGGGELASDSYRGNLVLTVEGSLSFTDGMRWAVRVDKPRVTASGRAGKPERVITLRGTAEQTVPDLLRLIAHMWELGEVVPGQSYEAPEHEKARSDRYDGPGRVPRWKEGRPNGPVH